MGHLAGKKINLTKNQSLVMEVLSDSTSPVSAYSILEKLRDKGFRAPLQVYRALDKLVASGMAHRIESVNAFVACNRSDDDSDSMVGFIICIDCGHVKEISDNSIELGLDKIAEKESFTVKKQTLEMHGLCHNCETQNKSI
ncbi:MAG: transcriptional repressor [Rhodospirillaceae bacterium]|nr:transcriptional repressor [Rhodospirillaceae bacterium]